LLLFVPFAGLTPAVTAAFWLVADLAAVAFVIRRLNLKWWWVLFPPILQAILPANPEPVVLAFLVAGRQEIQGLAPILKIYALAPLFGERRWRAICIALILLVATVVILPWGLFITDLPLISDTLAQQTTGLSAFPVPWLLPVGVIGLLVLGLRRAGWLAVPVLWPHSQIHYATTALPEITPILAVGFSLPIVGAPPVAVAIQAVWERWRTSRGALTRASGPGSPPTGANDAHVP
jgi:hypothetical protein